MSSPSERAVRVLAAGQALETHQPAERPAGELWLRPDELHGLTGWELKPEGLCKDEVCVPLPPDAKSTVEADRLCASSLWKALDRPVLHDAACETWILGEGADDRARQLTSLEAPDFTLPDIHGKLHSLSDYRGKKVLLATWASW